MATTPALRLLLNNSRASLRLIRGSPISRSGLLAPAQLLGQVHFQEPPRAVLELLMGGRGSASVLPAGRSLPAFGTGAARSYCRGGRGSEISDNDDKADSDEDLDDDGDSDDDMGGFDSDDVVDIDDDSEDEKPWKRKW